MSGNPVTEQSASIPEDKPFILFADDDPDTLTLFVILAAHKGWLADRATTAREIIAKVNFHCAEAGQCYDVIVSDVNFFDKQPGPRLSGITAIGEIRKKWSHIPVVFYSAFLNTVMRDEIKSLGNTEAIEKASQSQYGASSDVVGVIERVELILDWTHTHRRKAGQERRKSRQPMLLHRRLTDCQDEIILSPTLESAVTEAHALRQLHAAGGKRG